MSDLFIRNAWVTVAGFKFTGRIQFEVYKGPTTQAMNKSKVSIFNLSKESRFSIDAADASEDRKGKIKIFAGYNDDIRLLFVGDFGVDNPDPNEPPVVNHERKGPDIITTIEMLDGGNVLNDQFISISLGPGATDTQIFSALKDKLGIPVGVELGMTKQVQFKNGFSFDGSVKKLISDLSAATGTDMSIQNGVLNIVNANGSNGRPAILLNKSTGLIGVPNKSSMGFRAKALLNPLLEPYQLVKVESIYLQGSATFSVNTVKHVGDTHDNDWYSEITGGIEDVATGSPAV